MHALEPSFDQATDRGYSGGLWNDCPVTISDLENNPTLGWYIDDDFTDFPLAGVQTTQIGHGKYKVFNTGAGTVAPVSTLNAVVKPGGMMSILTDTANDTGTIAQAYPMFSLTGDPATSNKMWCEARIAIASTTVDASAIVTDGIGFILGLANTSAWTLATAVPLNGGDAFTAAAGAAFVGFRKAEDGLGVVNTGYLDGDAATALTVITTSATAIASRTFIKLGMKYDPTNAAACVTFYANGVPLTGVLSRAALVALTNLDANALGLIFSQVADTAGTAIRSYIDMWRCIQIPVNNSAP